MHTPRELRDTALRFYRAAGQANGSLYLRQCMWRAAKLYMRRYREARTWN